MDESRLSLDLKPSKVIALKGAKKVHCRTSGNKMQITILACANAAGTVIPPMVIFEGKRLNPEWTKGEVPCTLYGMSDKDTIRYAASQGVIVMCLPPHTTHISQPLDVSFFKPLKTYWSEVCHRYMQDNPGRVITKYQFSSLFSTAWYKAVRPENIVSGFRKVGVCPFDSTAITVPEAPLCVSTDETGGDEGGNKFSDGSEDENAEYGLMDETESCVVNVENEQLQLFEARYENRYQYVICSYLINSHCSLRQLRLLSSMW